ncbi:MAG TPA: hypothetical protein VGF03_01275 [Bryobacteraceae bacterium]
MQVLSLVWGIVACVGLVVGFLPCLGALNWINIPFSLVGLVISVIATTQEPPGRNGPAIGGIVLCSLGVVVGFVRLILGGGVL